MNDFNAFGLAPALLRALTKAGYTAPTPIQQQAIPLILEGRDVLGIAQTGTGKTAAFALPSLQRLIDNPSSAPRKGCRILALSPTRELALQIADSFRTLAGNRSLRVATVYGGVPYGAQIRALSTGVDVLVATAGRLMDHIESGHADLSGTEILILDEVDQMLDMGFIKPIRQIVSFMAHRRQNLFFSATMPTAARGLATELLRDPIEIAVAPQSSAAEKIKQTMIMVETRRKRDILRDLFADPSMTRAIIFARTKHGAERLATHLEKDGITAQAIHGDKSQNQRERALRAFRDGSVRALVATDVAARGIDVDHVSHVINYDLPDAAERYVHRIGRTARAGSEGAAISLCDRSEEPLRRDIEKLLQRKIETLDYREPATIAEEAQRAQKKQPGAQKPRGARSGNGKRKPAAANATQKKRPARQAPRKNTVESAQQPLRRKKSA